MITKNAEPIWGHELSRANIPLTLDAEIGFITSEPKPFSHRIRSRGMRSFRIDRDMEVKGVGYALGAAALFGASTPAA
jgi:hypothetical protein